MMRWITTLFVLLLSAVARGDGTHLRQRQVFKVDQQIPKNDLSDVWESAQAEFEQGARRVQSSGDSTSASAKSSKKGSSGSKSSKGSSSGKGSKKGSSSSKSSKGKGSEKGLNSKRGKKSKRAGKSENSHKAKLMPEYEMSMSMSMDLRYLF